MRVINSGKLPILYELQGLEDRFSTDELELLSDALRFTCSCLSTECMTTFMQMGRLLDKVENMLILVEREAAA